jgi:hypothetical protein
MFCTNGYVGFSFKTSSNLSLSIELDKLTKLSSSNPSFSLTFARLVISSQSFFIETCAFAYKGVSQSPCLLKHVHLHIKVFHKVHVMLSLLH